MKNFFLYIFLLSCILVKSQDKIYFTNGSLETGKVTEIGTDEIKVQNGGESRSFNKDEILMIAYKNGTVEKYNSPEKEVVYTEDDGETKKVKRSTNDVFLRNQVSLNTLALVNSDVSVFFERMSADKKIGFGAMAAYNFNPGCSFLNNHVFLLTSAKKNYDIGIFINLYAGGIQNKTTVYYGLFFKYMQISFTSVTSDSVKVGNVYVVNTKFTPSTGSQLATIFTIGTHSAITKNFFIKTLFGIGGFNMRGSYKQQYNYLSNSGVNSYSQSNRTLLSKLYLGINAGFNF